MRIELVVGTTNVVRFPVERRVPPTIDLLRDIAPDVREVLLLVENFGLSLPERDPRQAADAAMADHIVNHVRPEPGAQRRIELDTVLAPVVARAVAACCAAHEAALAATDAQQRVVDAQSQGGYWLQPMEERAETLTATAAQYLVEAHLRSEEAEGTSRAISLAKYGATWTPFNLQLEAQTLFFGGQKSA